MVKRTLPWTILLLLAAQSIALALPAGYERFYVLGRESQIYSMFKTVETIQGSNFINSGEMASIVALTATEDFQVIYYDHWEDGFEDDLLSPSQSSTEVFGNGDPADGGLPADPADLLSKGETVLLPSDGSGSGINDHVPCLPRGNSLRYDGGDRLLSSGGPINVVHANYPADGSYIGGAWELYAVRTLEDNLSYRVPVGVDSYVDASSPFSEFQSVFLQVSAPEDDTTVVIDNGVDQVDFTLERGETYSSEGFIDETPHSALGLQILEGTTVYASSPIQAGIVTAGPGTFQSRFFQLIPEVLYGTDYINPVPSLGGSQTELYLFNPSDQQISVTAWDANNPGGASFNISANSAVAYSTAVGSGVPNSSVRLKSDSLFWGVGSGDSGDTAYDWGYSLVPQRFYDRDLTAAWAPGSLDLSANYSPLYLAPSVDATEFQIDFDGDGVNDGVDINGDGSDDAGPYLYDVIEYMRVFDSGDNDQSGARVSALDPFISAYGADPSQGGGGSNLDWGYTVLPLSASFLDPVLTLEKQASPVSLPKAGGSSVFTLTASAQNHAPVSDVDLQDTLPLNWTYTPGSAHVTYPSGDTFPVEPSIAGQTLLWDLSETLSVGEQLQVTFEASILTSSSSIVAADDLETADYSGGFGFSSNWLEGGESDGPGSGSVQVDTAGSPTSGSYQINLNDDGYSIARGVDSSSLAGALELFFKLRIARLRRGWLFFEVSTDGGSTWTTVRDWFAWNTYQEGSHTSYRFDMSSYKSSNFVFRFRNQGLWSNADFEIYIDDVEMVVDPPNSHLNEAQVSGVLGRNTFISSDEARVYTSDLLLSKEASSETIVAGGEIEYTIVVENSSSSTLNSVVVGDPLPSGTSFVPASASPPASLDSAARQLNWSLGSLAPGASQTLVFSVSVGSLPEGTVLENQARASADGLEIVRSDRVETTLLAPELRIEKRGSANVEPGGDIDYEILYRNEGSATASNGVVADSLPANTAYVVASASPGAEFSDDDGSTWTYSPSGLVDGNVTDLRWTFASLAPSLTDSSLGFSLRLQGVPSGGRVINWASIDSDETARRNSNVSHTYVSEVLIEKGVSRELARPGDLLDFDLNYWNEGSSSLASVIVTDVIPEGCSYVSDTLSLSPGISALFSRDRGQSFSSDDGTTLPDVLTDVTHLQFSLASLPANAASTASVSFTVRVSNPLLGDTTIANRASLRAPSLSTTLYSNEVRVPTVDYSLAKDFSSSLVLPGQTVDCVITYSNNGSYPATSTQLVDYLPPELSVVGSSISHGGFATNPHVLSWNLGDLPASYGPATLSFSATVAATASAGAVLSNLVRIGNSVDRLEQNAASDFVTVSNSGLTISADSRASGDQGDQIVYAHRVFNTSSVTEALELRASHDSWASAIELRRDQDGDGVFDPSIDTLLFDGDGDSWYETPPLDPGEEFRLLLIFDIDPEPSAQDGDEHITILEAKLSSSPPGLARAVEDLTEVLAATKIDLLHFEARGEAQDLVRLCWKTAAEIESSHFIILRSDAPDDYGKRISFPEIEASGARFGATYSFEDSNAKRGELYWYWLVEVDTRGRREVYGPAAVDWDGDGIPDYWEREMGLSPTRDDGSEDPDGDGSSNREEYERGRNPFAYDDMSSSEPEFESRGEFAEQFGFRVLKDGDQGLLVELRSGDIRLEPGREGLLPYLPGYSHGWRGVVGEPRIPQKGIFLPIPRGKAFDGVQELTVETWEVAKNVLLRPNPEKVFAEEGGIRRVKELYEAKGSRWTLDEARPAVRFAGIRRAGEERFLHLLFEPVAYRPLSGRMSLRRRIVARVLFDDSPGLTAAPSLQKAGATLAEQKSDWDGYPREGFYRIRLSGSGIFALSHFELQAAGWSATAISGENMALFSKEEEIPLFMEDDGEDGFGPGDRLLFYHKTREGKYDSGEALYLCSDIGREGLRVVSHDNGPSPLAPVLNECRTTLRWEENQIYGSSAPGGEEEDRFYGAFLVNDGNPQNSSQSEAEVSLSLSEPKLFSNREAFLRLRLNTDVSSDELEPDHRVEVFLSYAGNWISLGQRTFDGAGPWLGEFPLSQNLLGPNPSFKVVLGHRPGLPQGYDRLWVDWLDLDYLRDISLIDGSLEFVADSRELQVEVENLLESDLRVWTLGDGDDLVRSLENLSVTGSAPPYSLTFPLDSSSYDRAVVICEESSLLSVESVSPAKGWSIREDHGQTDLIVVCPEAFSTALAPLLERRRTQGSRVRELSPKAVYDAFSSGVKTPWAFRSMLSHALSHWEPPAPRYLLLVGDATYDPRNYYGLLSTSQLENMIPSPLSLTFTWGETPCDSQLGRIPEEDSLPVVAVGRLPVKSSDELDDVVDKLLAYDLAPDGAFFESKAIFVSGRPKVDEDFSLFERAVQGGLEYLPGGFSVAKIDETSYPASADARDDLLMAVQDGALLLNYHGHGSLTFWADGSGDRLLGSGDLATLQNDTALPIVIGMTCLSSFFATADSSDCLAEEFFKLSNSGAIATFSSAALASVSEKEKLSEAMFEALFQQGKRRLGDAYLHAAQSFLANGEDRENVLDSQVFFGDPSMELRLPFPDSPEAVKARWIGDLSVELTWQENDEGDLAGYRLLRSANSGGPYDLVAQGEGLSASKAESYVDRVPRAGTYYYVLRAYDESGFSSPINSEAAVEVSPSSSGGGGGGGCSVFAIHRRYSALGSFLSFLPLLCMICLLWYRLH